MKCKKFHFNCQQRKKINVNYEISEIIEDFQRKQIQTKSKIIKHNINKRKTKQN